MRAPITLALAMLLAACSAPRVLPPGPPPLQRDGPEAVPPIDPMAVPDAVPRVEPIPPGGPNKPYEIAGQRFEPIPHDRPFKERGIASWYGRKFHGRSTANGETYNMYAMSAAHKLLPLPSYVRVRNPANGREVIVRVNDRGPFVRGRIIDLSYTAAARLDLLRGIGPVEIERITFDEIRSGRWQAPDGPPLLAPPSAEGAPPPADTQSVQPLGDAGREVGAATRGLWLQLGAFRQLAGAESLMADLAERLPDIAVKLTLYRDRGLHRVQLGPLAERELAQRIAQRLKDEAQVEALLVNR
jgi:rare lipoprotein A